MVVGKRVYDRLPNSLDIHWLEKTPVFKTELEIGRCPFLAFSRIAVRCCPRALVDLAPDGKLGLLVLFAGTRLNESALQSRVVANRQENQTGWELGLGACVTRLANLPHRQCRT